MLPDYRAKFLAISDGLANTFDRHIGDLVTVRLACDLPDDLRRRLSGRLRDLCCHNGRVALLPLTHDLKIGAAILSEVRRVDLHHVVLEGLDKLLSICVAGGAPILTDREAGDARNIEILLRDGAQPLF